MGDGTLVAITTDNDKFGVIEWCSVWEPGLPFAPGTLGQDDKQQLLHDYPGVLYATSGGAFILDLNTRIFVYLCTLYSLDPLDADLTSMICRYLDDQTTGDYDQRFQHLIDQATP
jgi:hypothetical protein